MKYLICFSTGFCGYVFCIYYFHILISKPFNWKSYKPYVGALILSLFILLTQFVLPQYTKILLIPLVMGVIFYYMFKKNLLKAIIGTILIECIFMIAELLLILILSILGINVEDLSNSNFGLLFMNAMTIILLILLSKIQFIKRVFNYLNYSFQNMKNSNLIVYFIITIVLITVFMVMSYMNLPMPILLGCNVLLAVFYIVMLFRMANANEKYRSVNSKYETSINSLREYEDIMDKYKVANHENKNQLLTIRNMVKDKKVQSYIDKLVENKIKDNETIFYKTSKIPEGGLRATIYSKLCKMDSLKIKYVLDISKDIRTVDLIKIGDTTTLNICKVIGVFLDNAIEAVTGLKKKTVRIEIYILDGKLILDIANNYRGTIDVDKIFNKGYTTKGKGHGYGLSLVKDIVKSDACLENEVLLSKTLFTQRLKIKM